jgi:hypothetical protein
MKVTCSGRGENIPDQHTEQTIKLRMQGGDTIELKVPEQSLVPLSKGDSVQVSIHKAAGRSSMLSSPQSRPGSDTGTTGSPGTRSR